MEAAFTACSSAKYFSSNMCAVANLTACLLALHAGNLGKKKEGELSSYSIFNPGARRLPGQLDADQIDQQMRRGQM